MFVIDKPPEHLTGLPREALEIWVNAANEAMKTLKDEEKAVASANEAVKKAGYTKGEDGKWAKAEKHDEGAGGKDADEGKEAQPGEEKPKEEHKEDPPAEEKKPTEDFKEYEGVLAGVALLGADVPAVKTLSDIEALGENGDIENVEIFEAGYHKGKWYGLDYLDRVVKAFDELKDRIKPPVKLGHGEQDLLKAEGLPAGGWVTSVKRVGRMLVVTLSDMPEKVRTAIANRRYKRISAEFYPVLNLAEEKREGTWLSKDTDQRGGDGKVKTFTEKEVELEVEEKLETETLKFREEIAKLKKERSLTDRKLGELEEQGLKAEVDKFVEDLRATGLAPAVIDGFGLGELYRGLKRTDPVKFSDEVEATQAECFAELMGEIAKRAKEGKLVLSEKELAAGKEHETFGETEKDEDERAKEWAAEVNPAKKD